MHGKFIESPISFANIEFITLLLRIDDKAHKMSKMLSDLHIYIFIYIVFLKATHRVGIGIGIHF